MMPPTHTCFVCQQGGILATGELHTGDTNDDVLLLGQCPACERFVCARHAERVTAATLGHFPDGTPASLAHCPFDPGVPLGPRPNWTNGPTWTHGSRRRAV